MVKFEGLTVEQKTAAGCFSSSRFVPLEPTAAANWFWFVQRGCHAPSSGSLSPLPLPLPLPLSPPVCHHAPLSVRALLGVWLSLSVPLCLFTVGQSTPPDALSSRRCFSEVELTALRVAPTARLSALPPLRLERNMWQGHYLSTAAAAILLKEANGFATIIEDTDGQTKQRATCPLRAVAALRCTALRHLAHTQPWCTVHCCRHATRRLDMDSYGMREPFRCRWSTPRTHRL